MPLNRWLTVAAVNGAVAVIAGAFAAHALKTALPADMVEVFKTGAQYELAHALALGLVTFAIPHDTTGRARLAGWLFLIGIVLFSGSLYALALTGIKVLGIITPFGGVAFIAGWLALAAAGLQQRTG